MPTSPETQSARTPPLAVPVGLRHLAKESGLLMGAAVEPSLLVDPRYARALAAEFDMIEPENAMKWRALRPSRDRFDFAPGDAVAAFAAAHGQCVRGHVLAWHAYLPSWLRRGDFPPAELEALMRDHIAAVVGHFRGRVFAWDVLNEAFADSADGALRSSIWYDRPGIGFRGQGTRYAEMLFRWAHDADPQTLLFYNDDVQLIPAKFEAMFAMLRDFRERGVPIDGVGLQLHLDLTTSLARLDEYIGRLGELSLVVHVTELDVAVETGRQGVPRDPDDLFRQAEMYRLVLESCLRAPHCAAVQTWGVDDAHSWIPTFTRGRYGAPLLLDAGYRRKPAWEAAASLLASPLAVGRHPALRA